MLTYTMSESEAQWWESDDAAERDLARRVIRERAEDYASQWARRGGAVEIVAADGCLMDTASVR